MTSCLLSLSMAKFSFTSRHAALQLQRSLWYELRIAARYCTTAQFISSSFSFHCLALRSGRAWLCFAGLACSLFAFHRHAWQIDEKSVAVQAAKYVSSRSAHSVLFFLVLVHVSYWVKVRPNRSCNIMTSQNQRTVGFYLTFREVLDISRAVRLVRTSDAAKN